MAQFTVELLKCLFFAENSCEISLFNDYYLFHHDIEWIGDIHLCQLEGCCYFFIEFFHFFEDICKNAVVVCFISFVDD